MIKGKDFSTKNNLELIFNGKEFLHRNIELISKANNFIILQTYIFENDEETKPIIKALRQKAEEGVDIFILIDGFGSRFFPEKTIQSLRKAGIQIHLFSPLFSSGFEHIGRRLHSKALIIDGKTALVGGINLSKSFNAPENSPPWLDFACQISGEEVPRIIQKNLSLYLKYFPKFIKDHLKSMSHLELENECLIRTNINDWMRLKNEIYISYIHAIRRSSKQIIIVATYFVPGKRFLTELSKAAKRGVDVSLIFSAESDHPIERWSSKYLYSWYLNQKIKIYEWGESIVHGKLALIDDHWVTIGSFNHNFISRFLNHELNLEITDQNFAGLVQKEMDLIISKSSMITLDEWNHNNSFYHKILETLSYVFANALTLLSMFLIFRRKDEVDINLID